MSERTKNLRNVGIILVLAGLVYAVPGGGTASAGLGNVLSVILFAGLAFFAYRLYMEHRMTLMDLPDDQRLMLYGAVTTVIVALLATGSMWNSPNQLWILVWFLLLGAATYALLTVVRKRNEY